MTSAQHLMQHARDWPEAFCCHKSNVAPHPGVLRRGLQPQLGEPHSLCNACNGPKRNPRPLHSVPVRIPKFWAGILKSPFPALSVSLDLTGGQLHIDSPTLSEVTCPPQK